MCFYRSKIFALEGNTQRRLVFPQSRDLTLNIFLDRYNLVTKGRDICVDVA